MTIGTSGRVAHLHMRLMFSCFCLLTKLFVFALSVGKYSCGLTLTMANRATKKALLIKKTDHRQAREQAKWPSPVLDRPPTFCPKVARKKDDGNQASADCVRFPDKYDPAV